MAHILNDSVNKSQEILLPWPNGQWREDLAQAIRDPQVLLDHLHLKHHSEFSAAAAEDFAFRVPWHYARLMKPGDPKDPLLQQVLPVQAEMKTAAPGYLQDPLNEQAFIQSSGLIQKYAGRVLIVTTGACAVHCRYCFRRHFPYNEHKLNAHQWQQMLDTLQADETIHEVILSGGDPLSLPTETLKQYTDALQDIPHIQRLRLHTRLPVALPQRVDQLFLQWLKDCKMQLIMVLHANHAAEISPEFAQATAALRAAKVTLLNQAVLLHGVNDDLLNLKKLSEALFSADVLPYYLHALDTVQGAQHFDVPDTKAIQLIKQLASLLPGYLVPKLVREIPGASNKTLLI